MSENSYWSGNGKYQKKYDRLQKLIPDTGHCEQDELDLLRIFGNLYYGLMNNGDFSIDNGNYHDDFKYIKVDLPEEIDNFKENMEDLEDYYYRRGDYAEIEEMCDVKNLSSGDNDSDYEIPDEYKAYLETLSYKDKQKYLECVVDVAILFVKVCIFSRKAVVH